MNPAFCRKNRADLYFIVDYDKVKKYGGMQGLSPIQ
jgi:hypothetical protein